MRRDGPRTDDGARTIWMAIRIILLISCYNNRYFFVAEGWNLVPLTNSPAGSRRALSHFTEFRGDRRLHRSTSSPGHRITPTKPSSSSSRLCAVAARQPRRRSEDPDNDRDDDNDAEGKRPSNPSRLAPSHSEGGGRAANRAHRSGNGFLARAADKKNDAAAAVDVDVEDVALCIVPPDSVWDTLQRARHVARDASAATWPPCIRLFHPLLGLEERLDALKVAAVVEQHNLKPFPIRLSQWAVVPHIEAMAELEGRTMDPTGAAPNSASSTSPREEYKGESEQTEIEALIDREERRGRINKARREERRRLKLQESGVEEYNPQSESMPPLPKIITPARATPRNKLQQQQRMYEEFNGPCVVCLEPDDESKAKLLELRELLRLELFGPNFIDAYSPTATATGPGSSSARTITEPALGSSTTTGLMDPTSYRPLVPIGAFATVTEAIKMARKLRTLWNPLTFEVTDLQLVSLRRSGSDQSNHHPYRGRDSASHNPPQVGCDAIVMLMGQEVHVDVEESQDMARLLCEKGEMGGAEQNNRRQAASRQETPAAPEKDLTSNTSPIMNMLDDDEDDEIDEGTVVVIGRTHFFTGEMRLYVGMPATSTSDLQVSPGSSDWALSRRRGAVRHSRRQDGEFGQAMADDDASDDMIAFLAENEDGT